MSKEIRELLCQLCDSEYPVWFAANELWNKVMRRPDGREASEKIHFVCLNCFAKEADSLDVKPNIWQLITANPAPTPAQEVGND